MPLHAACDAVCAPASFAGSRRIPFCLRPATIVVGHYGAGKTTFALNLAIDAAASGAPVTLVDLDVVNPYFRSSEYRALAENRGVKLIAPVFSEAGSSLDAPSLSGALVPVIERAYAGDGFVIVDAGGDDAGSTALGRFRTAFSAGDYDMLCVVNPLRNLTRDVDSVIEVLRDIEQASRLRVTGIVGNAHLKDVTDVATVMMGARFANEVAQAANVPLRCSTAPSFLPQAELDLIAARMTDLDLYPIYPYVTTPWER